MSDAIPTDSCNLLEIGGNFLSEAGEELNELLALAERVAAYPDVQKSEKRSVAVQRAVVMLKRVRFHMTGLSLALADVEASV